MKTDWVPCDGYGESVLVDLTGISFYTHVIPLLSTGLGVELLDMQVGVMDDTEDYVTSKRVVGQVFVGLYGGGETEGTFSVTHRTTLGAYSAITGDFEIFTDVFTGPFAETDANESFLHERHYVLTNEINSENFVDTAQVQIDPAWSSFDIRAQRRIQNNQGLVHIVQIVNNGVDNLLVRIQPFLRTFATSRG